jgi:4-hydroxythreonine-4-phosphate dehydrogenase
MGDPAGVGPELCLRTLSSPEILAQCQPVVFGHVDVLRRVSVATQIPLPADLHAVDSLAALRPGLLTVLNCPTPPADTIVPGQVSAACGAAGYEYIRTAIEAALAGRIAAVCTAPIHKEALRLSGVPHPGHTEIFTALTQSKRTCMMLRSDVLTVAMVTTHIGYGEVPQRMPVQRIVDVIELTAQALGTMNQRPARLAICGLNPHAGEHGLFGQQEEERFIEPAVAAARAKGIQIEGPLPPDTAFTTHARQRYDGVVCLYHDQGHIPFKMLAFDDGVNITLGLPIIRTSVDHGTAFDIAWRGLARPTSLFKAMEAAVRLSAARQNA